MALTPAKPLQEEGEEGEWVAGSAGVKTSKKHKKRRREHGKGEHGLVTHVFDVLRHFK
jgi:hypothetical protein